MGIRANIWAPWQVTLRSFNHSRGPDIPLTSSGMYEILDSTLMSRNALESILFLSQLLSVGPRGRTMWKFTWVCSVLENRHRKHGSAFEDKTSNASELGQPRICHWLTFLCSLGEWATWLAECKACLTPNSLLTGKHRFQDHPTHL